MLLISMMSTSLDIIRDVIEVVIGKKLHIRVARILPLCGPTSSLIRFPMSDELTAEQLGGNLMAAHRLASALVSLV
jgi:hypothetical protein